MICKNALIYCVIGQELKIDLLNHLPISDISSLLIPQWSPNPVMFFYSLIGAKQSSSKVS